MARADIRYRAVDDCSGGGIWCNQSVNVATENNPNWPKLFQVDFYKSLIYKYSKMRENAWSQGIDSKSRGASTPSWGACPPSQRELVLSSVKEDKFTPPRDCDLRHHLF